MKAISPANESGTRYQHFMSIRGLRTFLIVEVDDFRSGRASHSCRPRETRIGVRKSVGAFLLCFTIDPRIQFGRMLVAGARDDRKRPVTRRHYKSDRNEMTHKN
jgi:hypothetical protein